MPATIRRSETFVRLVVATIAAFVVVVAPGGASAGPPVILEIVDVRCSSFEAARFLVVDWTYGQESDTEVTSLSSDQLPGDTVEVVISTSEGTLSQPIVIPVDDAVCWPGGTIPSSTTSTTTTTVADSTTTTTVADSTTTTTVADSTTTTTSSTTTTTAVGSTTTSPSGGQQPPCVGDCLPPTGPDGVSTTALVGVASLMLGALALITARGRRSPDTA